MSKFELIEKQFEDMNRKKLERQAANLDRDLLRSTVELDRPDSNDEERERLLEEEEEDEADQGSSMLDSHSSEEESQEAKVYRLLINTVYL